MNRKFTATLLRLMSMHSKYQLIYNNYTFKSNKKCRHTLLDRLCTNWDCIFTRLPRRRNSNHWNDPTRNVSLKSPVILSVRDYVLFISLILDLPWKTIFGIIITKFQAKSSTLLLMYQCVPFPKSSLQAHTHREEKLKKNKYKKQNWWKQENIHS